MLSARRGSRVMVFRGCLVGVLLGLYSPPSVADLQALAWPQSVRYEQNRGQLDSSVRFFARASGYCAFIRDRDVVLQVTSLERTGRRSLDGYATPASSGEIRRYALSLGFVGGEPGKPEGGSPLAH